LPEIFKKNPFPDFSWIQFSVSEIKEFFILYENLFQCFFLIKYKPKLSIKFIYLKLSLDAFDILIFYQRNTLMIWAFVCRENQMTGSWMQEKSFFAFFQKNFIIFKNFLFEKISHRENKIYPGPEFWNFPDYGWSFFSKKKPSVFTRKKSVLIRKSVKKTSLFEERL